MSITGQMNSIADPGTSQTHPYTCLSCALAFTNAASQRDHYASDLHRYNAKRRVAGLNPVAEDLYNEKVRERHIAEGLIPAEVGESGHSVGRLNCKACGKNFGTPATYDNHLSSKKHKETVFREASKVKASDLKGSPSSNGSPLSISTSIAENGVEPETSSNVAGTSSSSTVELIDPTQFESSGDPKLDLLVAKRLRAAPPLSVTQCLFCPHSQSTTTKENIQHMRMAHSFVIPEEEYLVDSEGLLRRLGEEVGTWNVCIWCGKGYGGNINLADLDEKDGVTRTEEELRKRASKGIEAVRAHMQSKSHCKLPYDTESQRLDLADFYDFRPSYPDYVSRKQKKALLKKQAEGSDWEDVNGDVGEDEDGMEVVYESASEAESSEEDDSDGELPESEITYGDSSYELVLPSGARIGHRAHKALHRQNLAPYLGQNPFKASAHSSPSSAYKPSPHSQALLSLVPSSGMRRDKSHARPIYEAGLIPAKGAGFGGNGDVVRAKNKGEAKNANKATREFKEQKMVAEQAFIRGVRANSQKHYRDHLLQ